MEAIIVNERKHAVELKFDDAEIKLLKEAGLLICRILRKLCWRH